MAGQVLTRVKQCKQCGLDYKWQWGQMGHLRGACSETCRKERDRQRQAAWLAKNRPLPVEPSERRCEHCGSSTTRPRFCSVRCSQVARDRRNGVQPKADYLTAIRAVGRLSRDCAVCGNAFSRRSNGRDAGLCCSRECGFELLRRRSVEQKVSKPVAAPVVRHCTYCNEALEGRRKLYCEPCGREHWKAVNLAGYRASRKGECPDCGAALSNDGSWQRRCEPCRDAISKAARMASRQSATHKARKRAEKARRRAVERGGEAERFDPFEVFERDGWRCHLCKRATPKRLRGTYAPNAPELDHIIPLAKGGKHTRLNTACACRQCNGIKSDRILGQPSLLALVA